MENPKDAYKHGTPTGFLGCQKPGIASHLMAACTAYLGSLLAASGNTTAKPGRTSLLAFQLIGTQHLSRAYWNPGP